MSGTDEQAREALTAVHMAVHELRDLTHDLSYITTPCRIAGEFPTLMGRLANIAENTAEQLRRLTPHAGGTDGALLAEDAAKAMNQVHTALRALADEIHQPVSRAYSVVSHKQTPAAATP